MAGRLTDLGVADGTDIGNPKTGNFFRFMDSSNANALTLRDDAGTDTVYTTGVIPEIIDDWTEPALQTNTSATPADALNENTSNLPVGDYELTISANVSCDSSGADGIVFLTFDGNPITGTTGNNEIYRLEFKDNAGDNPPGAGTAQKDTLYLSYPVTVGVAGVKPVVVQIAPETNGVEMNIWNLYVKLTKK